MSVPPTILLAEDDSDLRQLMATAMRRWGYRVVETDDGSEAERLLQAELPNMLVTDMLLPGVSGFQLTLRAKELSEGQVPVVMMSGNTASAHKDYAHAIGADLFFAKPFDVLDMISLVSELCPASRLDLAPRNVPQPATTLL